MDKKISPKVKCTTGLSCYTATNAKSFSNLSKLCWALSSKILSYNEKVAVETPAANTSLMQLQSMEPNFSAKHWRFPAQARF